MRRYSLCPPLDPHLNKETSLQTLLRTLSSVTKDPSVPQPSRLVSKYDTGPYRIFHGTLWHLRIFKLLKQYNLQNTEKKKDCLFSVLYHNTSTKPQSSTSVISVRFLKIQRRTSTIGDSRSCRRWYGRSEFTVRSPDPLTDCVTSTNHTKIIHLLNLR